MNVLLILLYYFNRYLLLLYTHACICTGAQTEVLSLQELCIDSVAECLHSPEEAESLPLPQHVKEKIAEVVLDPQTVSHLKFYNY